MKLFIGTTNYLVEEIDSMGHLITGGPSPSCGTGCSSVIGDDRTMEVLAGPGVTSIIVNFANSWPHSPICIAEEENAGTVALGASTTVSTLTITAASSLTTKDLGVICQVSANDTY